MEKEEKKKQINEARSMRASEAKTVRRIVFFVISFLLLFFIITGYMGYDYVKSALGAVDPNSEEKVEIEIPIGSSSTQIAEILEENGIIKDARIFRFYIKFKNELNFQAGQYTLSPKLTMKETVAELQTGTFIEEPIDRVTIPEGKTLEEIAQIFSNKFEFDLDEFIELANDAEFIELQMEKFPSLLSDEILNDGILYNLEGYLFAGTYDIFDEDIAADEMITMMLERTNKLMEQHSESIEETEFSIHEILTLASVVERESKFSEDRPKVAKVFVNRIKDGMKLQSDITALYALREHKAMVTYADIDVDSPYNTYKVAGLPVGPIGSPSTESIEAVLSPEEDFDFIYFYARPNGETFYSNTLDEHNVIKDKYIGEWRELENEKES